MKKEKKEVLILISLFLLLNLYKIIFSLFSQNQHLIHRRIYSVLYMRQLIMQGWTGMKLVPFIANIMAMVFFLSFLFCLG